MKAKEDVPVEPVHAEVFLLWLKSLRWYLLGLLAAAPVPSNL